MHSQACDCTSNMLRKNSSVAKQMLEDFKKALPSHCLGYSTSLSVLSVDNLSCCIKDCMDACMEIMKLIKFSPKCKTILKSIKMANVIVAKSHKELKDNFTDCTPPAIKEIF